MSDFLDPFPYLDEPVYIANPQPYAGRVEENPPLGKPRSVRLPPPVEPIDFVLAVAGGQIFWLLVLTIVELFS